MTDLEMPEHDKESVELAALMNAPLPDDPLEAAKLLLAQGLAIIEDEPTAGAALVSASIATSNIGILAELRDPSPADARLVQAASPAPASTPAHDAVRLALPSRIGPDSRPHEVVNAMLNGRHAGVLDGADVEIDCRMAVTIDASALEHLAAYLLRVIGVRSVRAVDAEPFVALTLDYQPEPQ